MFWLAEVFNGSYSRQEIQQIEKWAHRQRAEAVRGLFSSTGRGLVELANGSLRVVQSTVGALTGGYGKYRGWQRRRAAIRELSTLSDRTLADIGVIRGEIPTVVERLLDGERQSPSTLWRLETASRPKPPAIGHSGRGGLQESGWQRAA